MKQSAIHPIIYVRGYAMTQAEIEDTVADPYMGFNLGSSKVRQLWDGSVKKYFFESPLVRLLKRFKYDDVFEEGYDRVSDLTAPSTTDGTVPPVSVSQHCHLPLLRAVVGRPGHRAKPDMKRFATGLSELILKLRERIYPDGSATVITDARSASRQTALRQVPRATWSRIPWAAWSAAPSCKTRPSAPAGARRTGRQAFHLCHSAQRDRYRPAGQRAEMAVALRHEYVQSRRDREAAGTGPDRPRR